MARQSTSAGKRHAVLLAVSLVFAAIAPPNAQGQAACERQFARQQIISTAASSAFSVFAADVDGDGDTDVLSASEGDNKIAWYENTDGLGTFGPQRIITTSAIAAWSVFAADLDGDGDVDVLSASSGDNRFAWYENTDGLGTFGPRRLIPADTSGPRSIVATDLDGDGDMDVLTASYGDDKIAWYENTDGLGTFSRQRVITVAADGAEAAFAADLDGDGDIDVLSASGFDNKIAWYENTDGLGTFGPQNIITIAANTAEFVFAADLDGDGDIDVLSASSLDDKIAWYENTDALGTFGPQRVITTSAPGALSVFAADLDGDGDMDVMSASLGGIIAWYENTDGLGTFAPLHAITGFTDLARSVFAADLDGDSDMDVVSASGGSQGKIAWYRNETDCNGNGVNDGCDLADGTSPDCNGSGRPDECEIADGTSADCNANGIPDDCEPGCNNNAQPDACDIANGTSADCNANGVPDECEPGCNNNGQPDTCDIADGTSADCDSNGIPDECDLASGVPDCNGNLVPDSCDIASAVSGDCNFDGVPDECQPNEDCDGNGVRDICDIGAGAGDCNGNFTPDSCEIAAGILPDVNGDGVPDDCCNLAMPLPDASPQIAPATRCEGGVNDGMACGVCVGGTNDGLACPSTGCGTGTCEPDATMCAGGTCRALNFSSNRYLAIRAPQSWAGQQVALRLTMKNLAGFALPDNAPRWVGEPRAVFAGDRTAPTTTFLAAPIVCAPVYREWSANETTYVYGTEIVPSSSTTMSLYDIQAIPAVCDAGAETNFSQPLLMTTSLFGDILAVAGCTSCCVCYNDMSAAADGVLENPFRVASGNKPLPKVGAVLGPELIDPSQPVNMNDVFWTVSGYAGSTYADQFARPDTCPHRVPSCGDGVIDPGEQCDDGNGAPGDGCDGACRSESATASYSLVPIPPPEATGLSYAAGVVIDGNDIFVSAGPQRVWFEVQIAGWGGEMNTWQATVDWEHGFASGSGAVLQRPVVACPNGFNGTQSEEICRLALGRGSRCRGFDADTCEDAFINNRSPDATGVPDPRSLGGGIYVASQPKISLGRTAVGFPGPSDAGQIGYGGNLAVDVPAGAAGTYTIGFDANDHMTFMRTGGGFNSPGTSVPIAELRPARLIVGSFCCRDTLCSTLGPQACLDTGGIPISDCGGDCNFNGQADGCDIATGVASDCNGNNIPDFCEADCNGNGVPDDCDTSSGTSADCNANSIPDECELTDMAGVDCNGNGQIDTCDITAGTSGDCNSNGTPDECERNEDCNTNGVQDICDIAGGASGDCNFDLIPDECQPDQDCDGNGTRDICDIGAGAPDCNGNLSPDSCDLASGLSVDANVDGVPDECCVSAMPVFVEPLKGRYLTLTSLGTPGVRSAIRVTVGINAIFPGVEGRTLWVGPPREYPEEDVSNPSRTFIGAGLTCVPYFHDWSTIDTLQVFGAEIVPSSRSQQSLYSIQLINKGCPDSFEVNFSQPAAAATGTFADIAAPFATETSTQPDFKDISESVSKFLSDAGAAIKASAQLQPGAVRPNQSVSFKDINATVRSFLGDAYLLIVPDAQPCDCPSLVTCGATACLSDGACGSSGTCINGFCADACGRCTP